jgi:peptidoglycan/LPS O-acetylase OafA/YrhL
MMGYTNPSQLYTTPGYDWTINIPLPEGYPYNRGRVWWGWGGILVVSSICHLSQARKVLELPVIQHLGKISFMLYLSHLLVNLVISLPLRRGIYSMLSLKVNDAGFTGVYATGPIQNLLIFFFLLFFSIIIAVTLAHFLEIWVDRPCTAFGRWVDVKLVHGSGPSAHTSASHEETVLLRHQEMEERDDLENGTIDWEDHLSDMQVGNTDTTARNIP